jgi:hypothetical protein
LAILTPLFERFVFSYCDTVPYKLPSVPRVNGVKDCAFLNQRRRYRPAIKALQQGA